jgi:hypothetical protein
MPANRRPFRKKKRLDGGVDVDELAHPPAISEFDDARHLGE